MFSIFLSGACQVLRLTGGKDYPRDSTLAKFKRIGPDAGFSTIYRSTTDKHFEIFFVNETNLWAIGKYYKIITNNKKGETIQKHHYILSKPCCHNVSCIMPSRKQLGFLWNNLKTILIKKKKPTIEKADHLFSSPGPKVHVNYCHHLASVVCSLSSVNFSHFKLLLRNHLADWNRT